MNEKNYVSLNKLKNNQEGFIYEINSGRKLQNRLSSMGVINNKKVLMENNTFGPVVIKIGDTSIALGRNLADKIIIKYDDGK